MSQDKQVIALADCPRCGRDHDSLAVKKFEVPAKVNDRTFSWWAMCPKKCEPVLLNIAERKPFFESDAVYSLAA